MADVLTSAQRRYCISRIHGSNTKPEIALRSALWSLGFRYRVTNKMPGKPDILFTKARIAIFVDGCFWHACPRHFTMPKSNKQFWKLKITRNKERDGEVNKALRRQGWRVIRFWEHEVSNNLERCVIRLTKYLGA